MTARTKTTLELSDIVAIELECKKCGATMSYRIGQPFQPPTRCVACNHEQWLVVGGQDWESICRLAITISQLASNAPQGFTLRMEVTSPSASREADGRV